MRINKINVEIRIPAELPDSTSAPIIYYDFTPKYVDKLLVSR